MAELWLAATVLLFGGLASADLALAAAQPAPAGNGSNNQASAQRPTAPTQRFDIDDFAIRGADKLPQVDIEEAVYPFLGPNKSAEDVEKARAALEKAYHNKGFQTVSVSVPEQNALTKVVTLQVTELKIGRYHFPDRWTVADCRVIRRSAHLTLGRSATVRALEIDTREVRSRFAILDQQFSEDPYLPCGMLTWRADDICTGRRRWMTCHDRHQRAEGDMFMGEAIGQLSNPESCCRGGN